MDTETTIIGAGVVGLAIAARLSERKNSIVVLEKNEKYGMETSSRNSEVIHAGIYYPPGSLKARLCTEGREMLYAICGGNGIPQRKITKIITAADESDLPTLGKIFRNGIENGVSLEMLDAQATRKLEPNIRTCGSIFSPQTGIISAHGLMDYYYHTAVKNGVTIQHRCEAVEIEPVSGGYRVTIQEGNERSTLSTGRIINAAGLGADKIAEMAGIDVSVAVYRQYFVKGSYFAVSSTKAKLVSRLVYPVPLNEGLGVHALLDMGGRLKFGPDVEYLEDRRIDYRVEEGKRKEFAESVRRIIPAIADDDLSSDMSGIRAKLQRKGEPPKDFVIIHEKERGLEGFINLLGIDSPGLTSSPAIARYVERLIL